MSNLRAVSILATFMALTLPLMPLQLVLLRVRPAWARTFPRWYHCQVCRLMGVRVHRVGTVARDKPVLLVSNHVSWLDIPVLSTLAPVSFVAKLEVASWPFVSWLAKLQRTIFVDRDRRADVLGATSTMISRLRAGDHVVLFAEGTSGDGNQVLPFRTSLFAAAKPRNASGFVADQEIYVQTLAVAYTALHGLPLGRRDRPSVAWYGEMDMAAHAWNLLKRGPLDVRLRVGEPIPLRDFADRKALARFSEARVRQDVAELLAARTIAAGEPPSRERSDEPREAALG